MKAWQRSEADLVARGKAVHIGHHTDTPRAVVRAIESDCLAPCRGDAHPCLCRGCSARSVCSWLRTMDHRA